LDNGRIDENELRHRLALCCVSIHKIVIDTAKRFYAAHKRHYYLTPSSYMDLMKTYDKMMTQTKQEFLVIKKYYFSIYLFEFFRQIIID
jgi:dynein heavy chain